MSEAAGRRRSSPCSVCRRWFVPDARVRDKQRTCLRPECRAEQRRRTQAAYRRRNAVELAEARLRSQIERVSCGDLESIRRSTPPVLRETPIQAVKDVMGDQALGIILYFTRVTIRVAKDMMRDQRIEIMEEFETIRSEAEKTCSGGCYGGLRPGQPGAAGGRRDGDPGAVRE